MGGAFQTSRDIFTNPIWQDIPKFRIFFYIVGNAVFSHEGVRIGTLLIKRGQFLRSYRNLSEDLQYIENRKIKKYSVSVISRKIDQLVKEDRLKVDDTELGTLFTVTNYDEYQVLDNYKTKLGTELEQRRNSDGTELEQSGNNNKNVKKEKNDNKKTSRQKFKYESSDMELAQLLFNYIQDNGDGANKVKSPNMEKWANEIRLTRERDSKTHDQIKKAIVWSQNHSFWKTVILSPSKLREKYTQLSIKAKEEGNKKDLPKQQSSFDDYINSL